MRDKKDLFQNETTGWGCGTARVGKKKSERRRGRCAGLGRLSRASGRRGTGCLSATQPVTYSVTYSVGCRDSASTAVKKRQLFGSGELCPLCPQ